MRKLLDEMIRRSGRLDAFVDGVMTRSLRGDRALTPSELLNGMAAEIERGITLAPDGPLFPYNRISIEVKAENALRQDELRGALPADRIAPVIIARLRRQCRVPDDLRVDVRVAVDETAAAATYAITHRTIAARPPAAAVEPPTARLLRGDGQGRFTLREGVFNVGRSAEAHGRDGRLIRLNQIVLDGEDDSRTVSRVHARIHGRRSADQLTFFVFDDGSRHGSTIVRDGRTHKVHRGAIGVALKDGDEVYFGKVRLEFRMR